jgi:hypothetical protein
MGFCGLFSDGYECRMMVLGKAMIPAKALSLCTALLLAAALCLAQQPAPPPADHPPIQTPDRRAELSRLTEQFSTGPVEAAPVPRNNFIDEHIFSKIEKEGVPHAPLADDATFFRRLYLDLTGRLPDAAAAQAFVASTEPGKRDKLIDQLVGSEEWRERWTYWLLDLWRSSQNRIGVAGRNLFHEYVYDALQYGQPFDEMVREMLTSEARSNWYVGPASYLVRWVVFADSCVETAHEDSADDMAVYTFRHFLGINLQCVSCHDGAAHLEKMNAWLTARKRDEFYAQAAFFGKTRVLRRVELRNTQDEYLIDDKERDGYSAAAKSYVRVHRAGEGKVEPRFILGGEQPAPGKPLRAELARILTSHRQFARATVNRFWAELVGVGIVDPVDEFDLSRLDPKDVPPGWTAQPTHPELLEALAEDFERSGYNLQHLMKMITKSSTYQLSSRFPGEWKPEYARLFARKLVRRLPAEQVYDSIVKATGVVTEIQIPRTDKTVQYLVQTRGPYDARASRSLDRQFRKDIQFFLESFGQANREYNEPSREGSIIQAALMMNSALVKDRAKPVPGSFLAGLLQQQDVPDEEFARRLFWRFLTRDPDAAERDQALTLLAERGRKDGGEDLQWVLMNKVEFLFNY